MASGSACFTQRAARVKRSTWAASAALFGMSLSWLTPVLPWQAGAMALVATPLDFVGGLTMSAAAVEQALEGARPAGASRPIHQ